MKPIETIKIIHPDGFAIINKTDFDKSRHKIWKPKAAAKKPPAKVPADPGKSVTDPNKENTGSGAGK